MCRLAPLSIERTYEFSSAHFLPNHEGKCKEMHGHNYILTVEVSGSMQTKGPEKGMIIDFERLDQAVKYLIDILDHKIINDTHWYLTNSAVGKVVDSPTAEALCLAFAANIQDRLKGGAKVKRVSLWETSRSRSIYEA